MLSIFLAHGASGHFDPSLHNLNAHELKLKHDEKLQPYHFWLERKKDALPRDLMRQERRRAKEHAQAEAARAALARRQRDIKAAELLEAKRQLVEVERQLVQAERDAQQAKQNSNNWDNNRSTTEKVESKLGELRDQLRKIQDAWDDQPWFARKAHPLAERV